MGATDHFAGKRVTVLGLGSFGGGVAAARYLALAGARVTVTDTKPAAQLEASVAALAGLGVRFVLGEHRACDLREADLVVKSPAVPPGSPWTEEARRAGVPVTTELALALERLRCPFVAVTGSKGKSTTSGLAGAMLAGAFAAAGRRVVVAGNNERPLLDVVGSLTPDDRAVLEVSSFMADDLARARREGVALPAPRAVVFTALEPEHVNWHGTVQAYYEAKLSLVDLRPGLVAFPARDPELGRLVPARAFWRGVRVVRTGLAASRAAGDDEAPPALDVVARDGWAVEVEAGGAERPLFPLSALRLLGEHNRENALLAAVAARALDAPPRDLARGAATFEPLPHRLETVAVSSAGVRFVNDSMATTPRAAVAALRAVPGPVVLLAGGSDKGACYAALGQEAAAAAHLVVCLGAVRERIAAAVEAAVGAARARGDGAAAARVARAETFEQAFELARAACPPGGTVLLAPAAASFDMFPSFKARGERFRALARAAAA